MKKIFISCPPYYVTGGTELLHQLAFKLKVISSIEVFIYYPNVDWRFEVKPLPSKFEKYVDQNWIDQIEDSYENIIIFPETMVDIALKFPKSQKILWWLSVDNFYKSLGVEMSIKNFSIMDVLRLVFRKHPYNILPKVFNGDLFKLHLFQSEYARNHLRFKKIENVFFLSDYLSQTKLITNSNNSARQNIILFNPLKGYDFTKKLMDILPQFDWIPLEKKTNTELVEYFRKAKLYVDFGHHPGKDRLPREAVINGCLLLTSLLGSAKNEFDIPIKSMYKFDTRYASEIQRIKSFIPELLTNYEYYSLDFEMYKKVILSEEEKFEEQIKVLLSSSVFCD